MAKIKSVYVCQNCGAESPKWIGKCSSCGEWNSYVEEVIRKETPSKAVHNVDTAQSKPVRIEEVESTTEQRMDTYSAEFNRVLGGGLVGGSLVLLGGEPGIGKSTLILQVALNMVNKKVLYVSGEESVKQLKLRSERLLKPASECFVVSETSLEQIFVHIKNVQPDIVVIDSIQTISTEYAESSPGSVTQVRECSAALLKFAKESGIPVLLIGHINKEGSIAGPKVLEHIVDTVLQFEGDQNYMYRILRANKNRFGSTAELGIFEMLQNGLREVTNPSELLLSQNHEGLSGVAIASAIEGIRPFLIEAQALVSTAAYGTPQRSSTGFDIRRMNMLLAVLEKRAGFKLAQKDVFLNIAGGLKVNDPAIDLAIITSILSSSMDIALERHICMAGEVGLSGEIRPVNRIEQRILEAEKLGFKKIIIPDYNLHKSDKNTRFSIEVIKAKKVEDAFRVLFGKQ
ncbi:DNA repair protein RadA [Paludibacter jiangxiensis]|uniref:DNA repair protein RadA n=1 Tax=Paludibacter jiangxiensis TaxID=681398 RepID=A0A171A359_9BACT|nr:DNA repair protein RadA [Paludibacter jiangxiensis]GAT63246.1 DNA repair protein RadA/Sms [Paludibacter jiangxiensis]